MNIRSEKTLFSPELVLEKEAILRAVLFGIPKVAAQITLAPFEERSAALDDAERSYVQIARDIGYTQETARRRFRQSWIDCGQRWRQTTQRYGHY